MIAINDEQNTRLLSLEGRMTEVEITLASIVARLDTITRIGQGLLIVVSTALGVDALPLLGVVN